ncbi:MAG: response regulator [Sphingobacteriaceae bacterium]|nr:MAG: response regulator [Sphingobacteriaceae bacterium]
MNMTHTGGFFIIISANLLLVPFWLSWWFYVLILVVVVAGGFVFHNISTNKLLHQKAELESQLLSRTELLAYAKTNTQKAREDAATANQNKSLLLSKISHDIRTPMNTIMGMTSLLTETTLNPEQQEFASTILSSGENLLTIINEILMEDILEFSKVESGRELEVKEFDLRTNIEEVFDVFAVKAAQAGIELIYLISPDVPVQLMGDAFCLRQILINLTENALRVTTAGEVFIVVNLAERIEENRAKLAFEIRDTSAGMSPEKFRTVSNGLQIDSVESSHTNIGRTLTICKKLVKLLGGTLTVESEEQKGNTFKFTIETTFGKQNLRANTQAEMAKLTGKRILIADDNLTLSNIFKLQLERWKLVPFLANSGKQALQILTNEAAFDLAIIDMQMPGMDGVELTKAIKKTYPELPVILMNQTGNEKYKECAALFSAVVAKPIKHHQIIGETLSLLWQKGKDGSFKDKDQYAKQKLSVDFAKQYPLNILIAEDDKMNQKLVTKVLNKLGYEPKVCENGKDVLEEVSNKTYDLILMDVQMPQMDGLEATRMIRVCLTEQPVIIAMTANTLQGDREECLKAGMDDYIGKPVRLDGLVNIIEKWALQGQQKQ